MDKIKELEASLQNAKQNTDDERTSKIRALEKQFKTTLKEKEDVQREFNNHQVVSISNPFQFQEFKL